MRVLRGNRVVVLLLAIAAAGCSGEDSNRQSTAGGNGAADVRKVADAGPAEAPQTEARPEAEVNPILPESREWPLETAIEKLDLQAARVSAAVRLVRLSETPVHCVPQPLPAKLASRLAVEKVGEITWAIGIRDREHPNLLRSPALIDDAGNVTRLAEGAEEEVATLRLSAEPTRFPHLMITPEQVVVVSDEPEVGMRLGERPPGLRFEVREIDRVNYVLLMVSHEAIAAGAAAPDSDHDHAEASTAESNAKSESTETAKVSADDEPAADANSADDDEPSSANDKTADPDVNSSRADEPPSSAPANAAAEKAEAAADETDNAATPPAAPPAEAPKRPERFRDETGVEVARYRWDVYDLAFFGPAADKLPDPPGGRFEMDMDASIGLLPVGGELPPVRKNTKPAEPAPSKLKRPPF